MGITQINVASLAQRCIGGNIIASYYLSSELKAAGITNSYDQLKAASHTNLVRELTSERRAEFLVSRLLPVWHPDGGSMGPQVDCAHCAVHLHRLLDDHWPLTKIYAADPAGASNALVYGNVACIFLFQGAYSLAWTPLMSLYAPEILNYSIRANGVTVKQYANAILALVISGLTTEALYWVETKGRSLEEIDEIFEGKKRTQTTPQLHEKPGHLLAGASEKIRSAEAVNVLEAS
ncbi:hypothetical protein JCM24511_08094 [Saitozyma sp. JCM 24511]|nr:hypothetical protein JCM24511_08094 [Saitozyma sp. JCM 24511]